MVSGRIILPIKMHFYYFYRACIVLNEHFLYVITLHFIIIIIIIVITLFLGVIFCDS